MYKVLVVDDEELICLGIQSMIQRLGLAEIDGVLLAANAADAELLMSSARPSIVITDIQMPGTNGLEMIKTLAGSHGEAKFIVLSGYDEFQYAREAMKLGVMDYLLKPASMGELKNVLENAVAALNLEKQSSTEARELKYRQMLLENNLRRLFTARSPDEFDVRNVFGRVRQYFPYEEFTIGMICCDGAAVTKAGAAGADLQDSGEGWQSAGFVNDRGVEVIVVNHSLNLQYSDILRIVKVFAVVDINSPGRGTATAMSGRGSGIESLVPLYRQAEKALSYRIIMDDAEVIGYTDIKDRPLDTVFVDRKLNELHELLNFPKEEQLSDFIDGLFSRDTLANQSIDCVSRLFGGVNRQLNSLAPNLASSVEEHAKPFESLSTLQEVRISLKETAYRMIKTLKEEEQEKTAMANIMNYIRSNMGNEISLAVVANRASISYTHFSRLFKKRAGMNFSDFLKKVRMEEAKRLLDDPANKVFEVALKVGYNDPKHFTRAFRQYCGVSPMEYRSESNARNLPGVH